MLTRQTNVRNEFLFQDEFLVWVGKVGQAWQSRVKKGKKFSEKCFGPMLTRQTDVRK